VRLYTVLYPTLVDTVNQISSLRSNMGILGMITVYHGLSLQGFWLNVQGRVL
jgi:hypothetical protein